MTAITRRGALAGLSAAAVLRPDRALAAWPERNISLLHGLTAGGGVDVSARLIAEGLSRRLGQQVVVEPKPGAAGTLAAAQVARATPDGYTLGFIPSGHAVTAATYKSLPYRADRGLHDRRPGDRIPVRDRDPSRAPDPQHAGTHQAREVAQRTDARRRTRRGHAAASADRIFLAARRDQDPVVPFRGGNQALTELLGKRIDFLIDPPIALIGQIKSGGCMPSASPARSATHRCPRRDHRRGRLPGLLGHVVDGHRRAREAAGRSPSGSTGKVNELVAEPTVIERIRLLGSEPKAGPPENFKEDRNRHRTLEQGD